MRLVLIAILLAVSGVRAAQPVDYVNPFVGSTNFGTTNPGAVCPNGLMSVVPFNVMGSDENVYDKEKRWWSTPYEYHNKFFTGFSHVNLSGVGCPEAGSLLVMPTTGTLDVDYRNYGSGYSGESARPGYYTNHLDKYGITTEATATMRSSIERYTFPAGRSHILLNLGEGLTNESGATMKRVSATEIEGSKLLGTFCYNAQAVFPIYFVVRVSKLPAESGYWKKQRAYTGVKAEWDSHSGKYKLYTKYEKELSGDDIGAYFSFDTSEGEQICVQVGVSMVSCDNARANLDAEQKTVDFNTVKDQTNEQWNKLLSRVEVEGGEDEQKRVFYTALYHTLIHPTVLQDVNGEYPIMESSKIGVTTRNRYTVFSLWDTYRNMHQLMTLLYPDRQSDMVHSMIEMSREWGWMPKWELFGRETFTMEGDPAIPVIADTWFKGIRDFDMEQAYFAMRKSATTAGAQNPLRPDIDDYISKGYVPLGQYAADNSGDNSVSHALEYYVADHALAMLADSLGHHEDAKLFRARSLGYKNYFCPQYGIMRPKNADGTFLEPFDPCRGANFEHAPGFHEGSAWNYAFYVPHDIEGLTKLMGGRKKFVNTLQSVFDNGYYDPTNEPDIAYPYIFSRFRGEEWRTQKLVSELIATHFKNTPDGIPGNDDTGTMSAWVVFSMMGLYPDCPGEPYYTLTSPTFDRITIHLDKNYYPNDKLVIEAKRQSPKDLYICSVVVGGKPYAGYRISHNELMKSGSLRFGLKKVAK